MHFTVLQVVALLIAFLAQFSRIFAATKPFWGKLPAAAQVWLPPILPFAASLQAQLAGVVSWTDFVVALIVSAALLLPGAPSNRSAAPLKAAQPFKPPPLGVLMLVLCFAAGAATGCALFSPADYAHCLPQPAALLADVADILKAPDYEQQLKALALTKTEDAVLCAVQQFVESLQAKVGLRPDEAVSVSRGKAFLAKASAK